MVPTIMFATKERIKLLIVSAVCVFFATGVVGFLAKSQSAQLPRLSEFVARGHFQEFSSTGKTPGLREFLVAHREDGSFVSSVSVVSPRGEVGMSTTIFLVPEAKLIWLEPFTESSLTSYLTPQEALNRVQQRRVCDEPSVKQQIEARRITSRKLNQDVVKVTHKRGRATVAGWVAPARDCIAVEETESFPSGSHTVRWTDTIKAGVPDSSLFEVPNGYVERTPMEMENVYGAKYPGQRIFSASQLAVIGRDYSTHRKK